MKELHFITAWLEENFPNKTYFLKPVQKHFNEQLKNYQNNVIYFGLFSGNVSVISPFQDAPIQINETHTRPFIFSHLSETSSVAHTFTGWEISFLDLIFQHDFTPPTLPDDSFPVNQIYVRLGGCNVINTNLFTMYHKNGVIFNEIECLTPFNGVNETYSFSYDLQHFYSCNVNSLGQIFNYLACEIVLPPPVEPINNISYWMAVHPSIHPSIDRVVYIDANGQEQTEILPRSDDYTQNVCTQIIGTVISTHGAVTCEPIIESGTFTNQFTNQFN